MKKLQGLTLLEIIFSLSVSSILLLIAAPSMQGTLARAEGKSIVSTIRRSLSSARQSAIHLERPVLICGVDEQLICTRNNFDQIAVFIDLNSNQEIDIDDTIIHQLDVKTAAELSLKASFRRSYIQFNEDGSASQAGSFIYCNNQIPTASKRITISMSGRPYLGRDRNGDGIVELTNGQAIRCE